jgi:hypothetical protein
MVHRDAFVGDVRHETWRKTVAGNDSVVVHAVCAVAKLNLRLERCQHDLLGEK